MVEATSTAPETVYQSVGSVTVTYSYTMDVPITQDANSQPAGAVTVVGTSIVEGETFVFTQTQPAQVFVITTNEVDDSVLTPQPQTFVTSVGGSKVTSYMVITPSPAAAQAVSMDVVSTVGGSPVTIIQGPSPTTYTTMIQGTQYTITGIVPAQTVTSMVGGTPVTVGVISSPFTGFQAVSYTVVREVDGTPTTEVLVSTLNGPAFQIMSYTLVTQVSEANFYYPFSCPRPAAFHKGRCLSSLWPATSIFDILETNHKIDQWRSRNGGRGLDRGWSGLSTRLLYHHYHDWWDPHGYNSDAAGANDCIHERRSLAHEIRDPGAADLHNHGWRYRGYRGPRHDADRWQPDHTDLRLN